MNIHWLTLSGELEKYKYEVVAAAKNGHCFIAAIRYCIERDHGIIFTEGDIKKLITYEVFQNNNYYRNFYNGSVLSMLRSLDRYIIKGIYTHQVVDIAILAAATILRVNLCIYKNVNNCAILYSQPTNPPSPWDVYLKYENEHYDSICSMKNPGTYNSSPTFNLTQSDIDAFALIGATFHVTDPIDVVNGGKLYFVPPKNFAGDENEFDLGCDAGDTTGIGTATQNFNKSSEENIEIDRTEFVQNVDIIDNGVRNFNTDIQMMDGIEGENRNGECELEDDDDDEDDYVYEMFAGLDLTEKVPEHFQFEEDNSGNEDAVLDNSESELENVTPIKPRKKNSNLPARPLVSTPKAKKQLNSNSHYSDEDMPIDLTGAKSSSSVPNGDEIHIDLTGSKSSRNKEKMGEEVLIDLTNSASTNANRNRPCNSEPLNSDSSSFMSDSSSSTSRQKPRKYEKVIIDERRMARAPVDYVEEVPWNINGDSVYKIKCTEDNWIEKYEDGHYFFLRNST